MFLGKSFLHRSGATLLIISLILASSSFVLAGDKEEVEDEVKEHHFIGSKTHAWMGVYLKELDDALREALDYEEPGVLIDDVEKDGPAAKAGIMSGDIIVRVNDKLIFSTKRLQKIVKRFDPGEEVAVEYVRKGKTEKTTVTLGETKEKSIKWHHNSDNDFFLYDDEGHEKTLQRVFEGMAEPRAFMGVHLDDLNEQLGEFFGVKDGKGALIESVVEESPAEETGLKAGDVIVKIDKFEINDPGDVHEAMDEYKPGDEVEIEVVREKKNKKFKMTLGETEPNLKNFGKGIKFFIDDVMEGIDRESERIIIETDEEGDFEIYYKK